MKQTITPERLLGEYIGTLKGICAWDIPEQLREKLERRAKELQELQIEMEVQHQYKDTSFPQTITSLLVERPLFDFQIDANGWLVFEQKAFEYANLLKRDEFTKLAIEVGFLEDIYDITTMD